MSRIAGLRARLRRLYDRAAARRGIKQEIGKEGKLPLLHDLLQDVRYAARSLRRSPGFTVVAVLTLSVGIGAGTAMFSVLDGILLRELPVRDEEELVVLWPKPLDGTDHLPVYQGDLTSFRQQTGSFESVAGVAYQGASEHALRDGGRALTVAGTWVTGNLLSTLGVSPVLGRTLLASDDVPGAAPVMVIGHAFWQRYFDGDPAVLGRQLEWDGKRFTVVGVLPHGFEYPHGAEFWVPVFAAFPVEAERASSGYVIYDVVGRLRPGASIRDAQRDFESFLIESRLESTDIPAAGSISVVTPFAELISGAVRPTLWISSAAVALLLLIACINVANLLLIRGSGRTQELAIRSALGAGRHRLVRHLLTESAVLALLGGALGIPLAYAAVRILIALAPPELPRLEMIEADGRVLLFALGITLAAALLSGVLPAFLSAAGNPGIRLRGQGRTVAGNRSAQALRHGLVIGQVSLAILVVAGAGLLVRSLMMLQSLDMGFNEERLLVFETSLPPDLFPEHSQQMALLDEMLARITAIPGVVSAATLPSRPFSGEAGWKAWHTGEEQTLEEQATNAMLNLESVGPEYFRTLQLPILRGRAFDGQDREDSPPVAIVSESLARHTWPGEDPIGKRVKLGQPDGPGEWLTVVGMVGETRYRDLADPRPSIYLPTRQFGPMPMTLAVRTRAEPSGLASQVRQALQAMHPDWMMVGGGSMHELLAAPLARPRFSAILLSAFAALTLLLAAVGIYGALAATVRQRGRELGIRLALGATAVEVRKLVLRQGMRLALWGCAIGLVTATFATRLLGSLLFGISPNDPATFVAVAVIILGAAALACYLPARRASRVDPVHALRVE